MDVRQLRYFISIAQLGGFVKAASELRVAQSALSYQIGRLEDELQVKLLVRHRLGVTLTEAGRAVLEHAHAVMRELNELRMDATSRARYPSGQVSFAAPPSVARVLVPQVIERFRKLYPDVRLSMREGNTAPIHEWLWQGQVDLALLYDVDEMPQLETTSLLPDRMYLIGSKRLPSPSRGGPSVAELCDLPLVMTSTVHGWRRRLEKALSELDSRPHIRAEVDSLAVIKELVIRGFGYSVLPKSAVHAELVQGELWGMPIPELELPATLMLLKVAQRPLSLACGELQRLLTEEVAKLAREGWGHRDEPVRLRGGARNGRQSSARSRS